MAQVTQITINNQAFSTFRTTMNDSLSAINSMHSGTSRPGSATTGTLWLDTTNAGSNSLTIKFFDGSDDITFATIDTSANTVNFIDSVVTGFDIVTDTTPQLGGNLDLNSNNITGTGNINITGTGTLTENLTVNKTTGAELILSRNDTSIAVDDLIGGIQFKANDASSSPDPQICGIKAISTGATNTNPKLNFFAGESNYNANTPNMSIDSSGNITMSGDLAVDTDTLFVDASANAVGVGSTAPTTDAWGGANSLVIKDTSGDNGLTIISSSATNNGNIAFADSSGGSFSDIGGLITYLHNGDSMRFMTANAERMRLNSTGLGIGVSSPSRKLQVVQDSTSAGGIYLYSNAVHTGTDTNALLAVRSDSNNGSNNGDVVNIQGDGVGDLLVLNNNGTDRVTVQANGQLLVGTTVAPSSANTKLAVHVPITSSGADAILISQNTTGADKPAASFSLIVNNSGSSTNAADLSFNTASGGSLSERMRLTSTGLGVGTSAPTTRLDVDLSGTGETVPIVLSNRNTTAGTGQKTTLGFGLARNSGAFKSQAGTIEVGREQDWTSADTNIDSYMAFSTYLNNAGTEKVRITSAGLVGINNSAPSTELEVYGTIKAHEKSGLAQASILIDATATGNPHLAFQQAGTYKGYIHYLDSSDTICLNDGSGNGLHYSPTLQRLGIGTSAPTQKLEVIGRILINEQSGNGTFIINGSATSNSQIRFSQGGTAKAYLTYWDSSDTLGLTDGSANGLHFSPSNQRVGIGTSAPTVPLMVQSNETQPLLLKGANDKQMVVETTGGSTQITSYQLKNSAYSWQIENGRSANTFTIRSSGGGERVRIDASGNLLVGVTSTTQPGVGNTTAGTSLRNSGGGSIAVSRNGDTAGYFNRNTSDGSIVSFRKAGTEVGNIGARGGNLYVGNGDVALKYSGTNDAIFPSTAVDGAGRDNAIDLGASGTRFNDIYATNGTIQTSDRNEKQDIENLSEAEAKVAVRAKSLLKKYRWKSAVKDKSDDARIHFGIIAQDLQDAFTAEELDAGNYGMFISNTWTNEDGVEQTRLGVRYSELLAFIITTI